MEQSLGSRSRSRDYNRQGTYRHLADCSTLRLMTEWRFCKSLVLIVASSMKDLERLTDYKEEHCWQYEIRVRNLEEDLQRAGLSKAYTETLRVRDFQYEVVRDKMRQKELKAFIERHEWLGNLTQRTTHWFAAWHDGILAGVILMGVPNAFSKLLGKGTEKKERLISRGACISWSPKNLASSFMMWCIKWMVANTKYRLFTAYSDPTAKEWGTIYQAANFYYLGKTYGAGTRYINPYTGKLVSDRFFRQKTAYRKFAEEIGIEWDMEWQRPTGMVWRNVPDHIEERLREYSKLKQAECESVEYPSKHKYAYVLGRDKRETKTLRKIFEDRVSLFEYPKRHTNGDSKMAKQQTNPTVSDNLSAAVEMVQELCKESSPLALSKKLKLSYGTVMKLSKGEGERISGKVYEVIRKYHASQKSIGAAQEIKKQPAATAAIHAPAPATAGIDKASLLRELGLLEKRRAAIEALLKLY